MKRFTILSAIALVAAALAMPVVARTSLAVPATPDFAVGPQYDTTHVYVAPEDFDRVVAAT